MGVGADYIGVAELSIHSLCLEALEDLCEFAFDRTSCFDDGTVIEIECQSGR